MTESAIRDICEQLCVPVHEPHSLLDIAHLAHYALVESSGYNHVTPELHKYCQQGRLRDMTVILLLSHAIPTLPVPTTPRQADDTVLLPDEGEHFLRLLRDKQATLTIGVEGGGIERQQPFVRVTMPDSSTFVALWSLTGLVICFKTPSESGQHFLSKTAKLPMSHWAWESLQFFAEMIRKQHAAVKTTDTLTLSEPA